MKKKRLAAIILTCILLICPALPASALEVNGHTVIFTVLNNTLAPLRLDTMPALIGGTMYVPYTLFSENFGLGAVYNSRDGLLALSNPQKGLAFDLNNGGCYDSNFQNYSYSAIRRNGTVYVPASFVSSNFSLLCTYYSDSSVLRIKDITSSYSDSLLITMLGSDMDRALEDFKAATAGDDEPEINPFDIYFLFSGALCEGTDEVLDALSEAGIKAMFFVTADDIIANEALVRRIYVEGHVLGVTAEEKPEPGKPMLLRARLDEANAALDRVLNLKTRLASIPGGSDSEDFTQEHRTLILEGGYRCWDSLLSFESPEPEENAEKTADAIFQQMTSVTSPTVLGLGYGDKTPDVLRLVLDFLKEHECTVLSAGELVSPINLTGETR